MIPGPASARKLPARPIRPRPVAGRWRRLKDGLMLAVAGILIGGPLLPWPRAPELPQRALLFDFAGGQALVLDAVLGPRDLPLLLATLIGAALLLFFTNSLVGRVWCGFACPQTIWTDAYRRIEARLRPIGGVGLARAAWALVSLVTGYSMVSWFFAGGGLAPGGPPVATLLFGLFSLLTYLLAAHAQELVCTHMCPWPRLQAAMVDRHTALVRYDEPRGEPRGPLRRSAQGRGACVDCGLCVAVCPMGIDIRQGQQLACIGCGLCADACDQVMARTGQPAGLIGFAPLASAGVAVPRVPPLWQRPRPLAYLALLVLVLGSALLLFQTRAPVRLTVEADRSRSYVVLSDGTIRNDFALQLRDDRSARRPLRLAIVGLPGARLQLAAEGAMPQAGAALPPVGGDGTLALRVMISLPPAAATGNRRFAFVLADASGAPLGRADALFIAPDAAVP